MVEIYTLLVKQLSDLFSVVNYKPSKTPADLYPINSDAQFQIYN
jgi:hypothetical protein